MTVEQLIIILFIKAAPYCQSYPVKEICCTSFLVECAMDGESIEFCNSTMEWIDLINCTEKDLYE